MWYSLLSSSVNYKRAQGSSAHSFFVRPLTEKSIGMTAPYGQQDPRWDQPPQPAPVVVQSLQPHGMVDKAVAYYRSWQVAYVMYQQDGNEDVQGVFRKVGKAIRRLPGKFTRFIFQFGKFEVPFAAGNDLLAAIPGLQAALADDPYILVWIIATAYLGLKVNKYRQPMLPPGSQGNPADQQPMPRPQNPPPGYYPPQARQQPAPGGQQYPYAYGPPPGPYPTQQPNPYQGQQPPQGGQPYSYGQPPQAFYPQPGPQQQPARRPPIPTYPVTAPPPAQPPNTQPLDPRAHGPRVRNQETEERELREQQALERQAQERQFPDRGRGGRGR
jgi:hypothetical protein